MRQRPKRFNARLLAGCLRVLAAGLLLACAVAAGALQRSPWIIPALATAFSITFVFGRMAGARYLTSGNTPMRIATTLLQVWLIQSVLVGVLYLLGAGAAAVIGDGWAARPFAISDLWGVSALTAACTSLGLAIARLEAGTRDDGAPSGQSPGQSQDASSTAKVQLELLRQPVTVDHFFDGIYYGHADQPDDATGPLWQGSDARIQAAEARLGVVLPELLRALYRVQNGGALRTLCIPHPDSPAPTRYDQVLMPFSGYNDLLPTERLVTARETFLAFAEPDDDAYAPLFEGGTEHMVVLAQWYRETLFLDYSQAGAPSIGFVDFDRPDWQQHVQRWPDFAHFFASLRLYEDR